MVLKKEQSYMMQVKKAQSEIWEQLIDYLMLLQ